MQGLTVIGSDWNQIDHNKLSQNVNYGIFMMFSNNNTLFSNMIAETLWGSGFGMMLNSSTNNAIYHNDFVDSGMSPQAYDGSFGSPTNNRWNMSYPIGGNHWSDYSGSDTHSGPLQSIAGSDGIGDTPYDLFSSNVPSSDNYPLMTAPTFNNTLTAYFTVTPASGNPSTTFTFNATLSWEWSINSTPLQFRWDFNGDGLWDTTWSTNMYANHSYAQGGEYNVTMEVKDGANNTDNMTWHVEVEPLVIPEFTTLLVPICSMIAIFLVVGALGRRR
jgi:parallel beta-helix repeat protein